MNSQNITIEYIRGWFDRSSSINLSTKSLIARSKQEWPTRAIFAKLRELGIDCKLNKYAGQYELRVGRKEALQLWRKKIGFICKDKANRLDMILGG